MIIQSLSFHRSNHLSIVQLASSEQDTFEYITASKAIREGWLAIKEVGENADVNRLLVINESDHFVFLMDGDILAGAKQNRVVNTSILLAPHVKSNIPVSCVEQGRWRFVSDKFGETDYTAPLSMRHMKTGNVTSSLRQNLGYDALQADVWNYVSMAQDQTRVTSKTSNLSDVFEHKRGEIDSLARHFPLHENANGMAVFIGKNLVGVDLYNRRSVFAEYFPRVIRSLALERAPKESKQGDLEEAEAKFKSEEFMDEVLGCEKESFPGAGVGTDRRFEFKNVQGMLLGYESHMIHLTAIKKF